LVDGVGQRDYCSGLTQQRSWFEMMVGPGSSMDRKEQILAVAIDRLVAVGFEGFRVGDVARDVGINNATLIHHYPSKVALIRAVVERFTQRFEAVADATNVAGTPQEKLARHIRSSVELMRTAPEMFVVLNEIMVRARRDGEIAQLVSVPLAAWRQHIVALLGIPVDEGDASAGSQAEEIATACMAQLLGMGLLLNSTDHGDAPVCAILDRAGAQAVAAMTALVAQAL
jgi:AcrR family transcriptional regulator